MGGGFAKPIFRKGLLCEFDANYSMVSTEVSDEVVVSKQQFLAKLEVKMAG